MTTILFENLRSSRFQSNHQRGYFCRNTIISSGARNSTPPVPPANLQPCSPGARLPMLAATIKIGIATINLNAVVPRLRSRSGYSTENCTG